MGKKEKYGRWQEIDVFVNEPSHLMLAVENNRLDIVKWILSTMYSKDEPDELPTSELIESCLLIAARLYLFDLFVFLYDSLQQKEKETADWKMNVKILLPKCLKQLKWRLWSMDANEE